MKETHTTKNNYTLYVNDKVLHQSDDKMFVLGKYYEALGYNHNVRLEDQNHNILLTNYIK